MMVMFWLLTTCTGCSFALIFLIYLVFCFVYSYYFSFARFASLCLYENPICLSRSLFLSVSHLFSLSRHLATFYVLMFLCIRLTITLLLLNPNSNPSSSFHLFVCSTFLATVIFCFEPSKLIAFIADNEDTPTDTERDNVDDPNCKGSWSEWSSCTPKCKYMEGERGKRTRIWRYEKGFHKMCAVNKLQLHIFLNTFFFYFLLFDWIHIHIFFSICLIFIYFSVWMNHCQCNLRLQGRTRYVEPEVISCELDWCVAPSSQVMNWWNGSLDKNHQIIFSSTQPRHARFDFNISTVLP